MLHPFGAQPEGLARHAGQQACAIGVLGVDRADCLVDRVFEFAWVSEGLIRD